MTDGPFMVYDLRRRENAVLHVSRELAESECRRLNAEAEREYGQAGRYEVRHRDQPADPQPEHRAARLMPPVRLLGSAEDAKKIIEEQARPIDWKNWPTLRVREDSQSFHH